MNLASIKIDLENGDAIEAEEVVSGVDADALDSRNDSIRANAQMRFFQKVISRTNVDINQVCAFQVLGPKYRNRSVHEYKLNDQTQPDPAADTTVSRCRLVLRIANGLLPRAVRQNALDEWIDEIECAAAADKPVFRRTLSILFRSLPSLAWRARTPVRAHKGGGA